MAIVNAVVSSNDVSESKKNEVWNHISLGTDFDGMINPVDAFIVSDEFKNLRMSLKKYMPQMPQFASLSQGLTIDEILDRVMYDNAIEFVLRNYN